MLVLYKKENLLYTKVLMDLRLSIPYQNKLFEKGKREEMLLPEEVTHILTYNGNIRIWNGVKFIKLNLGQFHDIMNNNRFRVEEMVVPKKEEPRLVVQPKPVEEPKQEEPKQQEQPKKEEPKPIKVEERIVVKEEMKVVEEPKQEEPKQQEQPKKEEPKAEQKQQPKQQNDNKKQRHNNNNNNKQNQGGGK